MIPITRFSPTELKEEIVTAGYPAYRAEQICSWIYKKGCLRFQEMGNIPLNMRGWLSSRFRVAGSQVTETYEAKDETAKILIGLDDGETIESVLIPEPPRATVCISSQVGCPVKCIFCASGIPGFIRNLEVWEIIEQILHIKAVSPQIEITNLVFMGIGEPLLNYANLIEAIKRIIDTEAFGMSRRRITVSTIGIIDEMKKLAQEEIPVNLAVSLHSADNDKRKKLVPFKPIASVGDIIRAAKGYFDTTGREITFEYVMLEGINCGLEDAESLAKAIGDMPCTINLIPYNRIEGKKLRSPPTEKIKWFADLLRKEGLKVTQRKRKGKEIKAACGQLRRMRRGRETPDKMYIIT